MIMVLSCTTCQHQQTSQPVVGKFETKNNTKTKYDKYFEVIIHWRTMLGVTVSELKENHFKSTSDCARAHQPDSE